MSTQDNVLHRRPANNKRARSFDEIFSALVAEQLEANGRTEPSPPPRIPDFELPELRTPQLSPRPPPRQRQRQLLLSSDEEEEENNDSTDPEYIPPRQEGAGRGIAGRGSGHGVGGGRVGAAVGAGHDDVRPNCCEAINEVVEAEALADGRGVGANIPRQVVRGGGGVPRGAAPGRGAPRGAQNPRGAFFGGALGGGPNPQPRGGGGAPRGVQNPRGGGRGQPGARYDPGVGVGQGGVRRGGPPGARQPVRVVAGRQVGRAQGHRCGQGLVGNGALSNADAVTEFHWRVATRHVRTRGGRYG